MLRCGRKETPRRGEIHRLSVQPEERKPNDDRRILSKKNSRRTAGAVRTRTSSRVDERRTETGRWTTRPHIDSTHDSGTYTINIHTDVYHDHTKTWFHLLCAVASVFFLSVCSAYCFLYRLVFSEQNSNLHSGGESHGTTAKPRGERPGHDTSLQMISFFCLSCWRAGVFATH